MLKRRGEQVFANLGLSIILSAITNGKLRTLLKRKRVGTLVTLTSANSHRSVHRELTSSEDLAAFRRTRA